MSRSLQKFFSFRFYSTAQMRSAIEIVIEPLRKQDVFAVLPIFVRTYVDNEPVMKCRGLDKSDCRDAFKDVLEKAVKDGFSYVTRLAENGEIIGCGINGIYQRSNPPKPPLDTYPPKHRELMQIRFDIRKDMFEKLPEAQKIFEFRYSFVDRNFQKSGVASKLWATRLEKALNENCSHAIAVASGPIIYKMYEKRGFREISRQNFEEFQFFQSGQGFDHFFISLMAKKLD